MFIVDKISVLIKWVCITALILYFAFKVFHYFYVDNYCDVFSAIVVENSLEDIQKSKNCVITRLCKVWEINRINVLDENKKRFIEKEFTCIRKIESWIWKW